MQQEQFISRSRVRTDQRRCEQVAMTLRHMVLPKPREDVPPLPFNANQEANFWFFLAAICHQTSPVGLPALSGFVEDVERRGWDYLLHALRVASTKDRALLQPREWASFDQRKLHDLFGPHLSLPTERAGLIQDLGNVLIQLGWDSIYGASEFCNNYLRAHSPNLLEFLSRFKAYSDPVEKKSVFFLALMQNSGLWAYADEENLPAPVDYHEVRGHLRLQTVVIEDEELHRRICAGEMVSSNDDLSLRFTVRDAIQMIAKSVGDSPNALHYFFWNLFRTYCVRTSPHCDGSRLAQLPSKYAESILSAGDRSCPFRSFCCSADSIDAINEHKITTEFY